MSNDAPEADDGSAGSEHIAGPATSLFRSLTDFVATLVSLVQTRVELLTTELQEEVQRAAVLVVYAFVALLAAMIGLLFGALTVVFIYWDTHRVLAALLVTVAFFVLAVTAVLILLAKVRAQPRMLDATLSELKKDAARLRDRE